MFESVIVRSKTYIDDNGIAYEIPLLLTRDGPIEQLLDYLITHWDTRSTTWMWKVTKSVREFLEYATACKNTQDERDLFQTFRHRLITGTISAVDATDLTGLWWSARTARQTSTIIIHLTDFFNWWAMRNPGAKNPATNWSGSLYDRRLAEAAYTYRRNKAFLGHTWSPQLEASNHQSGKSFHGKLHAPTSIEEEKPPFPEERILDLIFKGFKIGNRYNYRDMLITLLLNGAGFRTSEPFHMFMWDVTEDPVRKGQALVLIHHPSAGNAPPDESWLNPSGKQRAGTRAAYLIEHHGLTPRNWQLSTNGSGWKGGLHETRFGGYYKQAYWFIPEFGMLFWELWNIYIEQVALIDPITRNHPYAWINTMHPPIGAEFKIGKYIASHAAAVRRIGLEPSMQLGTTPHCHRRAYAQRLRKSGFSAKLIRLFMHHVHEESQHVYTQADQKECLEQLQLGVERLNKQTLNIQNQTNQTLRNIKNLFNH